MKKRRFWDILIMLFLIFMGFLYLFDNNLYNDIKYLIIEDNSYNQEINSFEKETSVSHFLVNTSYGNIEYLEENLNISFCPKDDCSGFVENYLLKAKDNISCAFFDLDLINLSNILINLSNRGILVKLVVDDRSLENKAVLELIRENISVFSDKYRNTRYNNYMHNKFCVIDSSYIITGSANPTFRGLYKNNNNLIFIKSNYLSKNYQNEFNQLNKGFFGYKKKNSVEFNNLTLIYNNHSYYVENYFCPQNNCEKNIVDKLVLANKSVYFASFVLTSDIIENTLINLSNNGVIVEGIVEKRNSNSKGSEISRLNESFRVYFDKNKYTMHHKFFIIDREWVIFGSMNPTKSGDRYNDENILIIKDKELANKFYEEYLTLRP